MPSYRAVLTVGRVHPGGDAQALLPAAAAAVSARTTLEASSVGLAKGRPTATVRFTAGDDATARTIAAAAAEAAWTQAEIVELQVRRSVGTRWPLV